MHANGAPERTPLTPEQRRCLLGEIYAAILRDPGSVGETARVRVPTTVKPLREEVVKEEAIIRAQGS
jgi:hypothetical protein